MGDLPVCKLCGSEALHLRAADLYSCQNMSCNAYSLAVTEPEWRTLMAAPGGEAVAWRPKLAQPIPYVTGVPRESDRKHWEENTGVEIEYAYAAPPAVDDGVLRDAERYRFIERNAGKASIGKINKSYYVAMQGDDVFSGETLDAAIDAAMKEQQDANPDH